MSGEHTDDRRPLNPSARSSARLGLGEVDVITPGVIHVRLAGAVNLEHVEPIMRAADQQIARGYRVLIAIDADDVHGYKTEVRTVFQAWMRQHRHELEKVWVLFRSPLIKMGISMVNAFTGGMLRSFQTPEEFDAELGKATRRARDTDWLVLPEQRNGADARH
jgi:hypothetical protein